MTSLLQYIVGGLAAGSLYALAALGLTLIYKTTGVVNFANGEMAMFTTFAAFLLLNQAKLPYLPSFFGALLIAAVLGLLLERLFMRPVQKASHLSQIMVTLGFLFVLNGYVSTKVFEPQPFPKPVGGEPLNLGGVFVSKDSFLIFGVATLIMVALYFFFKHTLAGIALRATAQNLVTARLMGIPAGRVYAISWGVASVLGGIAGMLIAPVTSFQPNFMGEVAIKAFAGAIIGGFGSLPGAVVGSLILGVLENLVAIVNTDIKAVFVFTLILLVLVIRPQGIMGAPAGRKV